MKVTKESIDKKLGFDFVTYSSGCRLGTECDVETPDPFVGLTSEEEDFIIEYMYNLRKNDKK
ncbi:hypothetical protein [Ligilactobacillus ceti]|uniref:Uncharacterized protein n=1 Tax=Ligilactobacillus ceti DSM 22408 TaxID=1122146 RepID=A0A0R2KHL8_9LACO|nr:hypothetical protein [Ligilactobacillus ceti]KRN88866.1 hypothetical protein IV53_GL000836 [Ligilactobacillus ceti DSM 22408]